MPVEFTSRNTYEHVWSELHAILTQLEAKENTSVSARISQLAGTYHEIDGYPPYDTDLQTAITLLPRRWLITSLTNGTIDTKFMQVKRFTTWHVGLAPEHFQITDIMALREWPSANHSNMARAMCIAAIKAHIYDLQPRAEGAT